MIEHQYTREFTTMKKLTPVKTLLKTLLMRAAMHHKKTIKESFNRLLQVENMRLL